MIELCFQCRYVGPINEDFGKCSTTCDNPRYTNTSRYNPTLGIPVFCPLTIEELDGNDFDIVLLKQSNVKIIH